MRTQIIANIFEVLSILFLAAALTLAVGCTKPTRPIDPKIKRCAPWVCAGQEWPGDFTNCTCRED